MKTFALKPLTNTLLRKLPSQSSKIYVRNSEAIYALSKKNINYLRAQGNYTEIHTLNGNKIISSKTLKYYDRLLANSSFIRTHQSYLINLEQLQELRFGSVKQVILENGSRIPVSRSKFPSISSLLHNLEA